MKVKLLVMAFVLLFSTSAFSLTINSGQLVTNNGVSYADTGASEFTFTGGDDITAFLLFEFAGYQNTNTFGLYTYSVDDQGSVSLGDSLEIFDGAAQGLLDDDQAPLNFATTVTFDFDNGSAYTTSDSVEISENRFGFYITSPTNGGQTFYTQTVLNVDGFDHFLSFDTRDNQSSEVFGANFVLAAEDLWGGGDKDFTDMVVGISDIAPVPEPATLLLLGSGLAGLAFYRRKKMK